MNDDRLESLLRSAGNSQPLPPKPAPNLTERVLRTAARRQNQWRGGIVAAGLVSCYLGGMLTMWLCQSSGSPRTNTAIQVVYKEIESSPGTEPDPTIDDSAWLQDERPVETTDADSSHQGSPKPIKTLYELFRDLGDASHTRGDFVSAIRYYRLALDSATEEDFHAAADQDNLLLLSLKQDRIESMSQESQGESL